MHPSDIGKGIARWSETIHFRLGHAIHMNLKGTLPVLILQTLSEGSSHGYAIAQQIKARSKHVLDFKEGTLYPALHALENVDYVESYEATMQGRIRRYYRLTNKGKKVLDTERAEWLRLSQAVNLVLEGG